MTGYPKALLEIARRVATHGGRTMLIGGSVRDQLLGQTMTDWDVEIFGLSLEQIHQVAEPAGPVIAIGKSFGILQVQTPSGRIDLAAPRRETKTADGHRGFTVAVDPTLSPAAAARRRDFTINAIAEDILTGELIDPFGGQADLKKKILRVVDPDTFGEDPLRVWRAVQLVGRFGLVVEEKTLALLKKLSGQRRELSTDRIREEWKKLFLLAIQPSLGLELAQTIGLFEDHPALEQLINTPQDPTSHPEGNAWIHTLLATDQAAQLVRHHHHETEWLPILLGAFLHDIGKAVARTPSGQADATTLHGHAGVPLATTWLQNNGFSKTITSQVVRLIHDHMDLYFLEKTWPDVADGQLRRLVNHLWPAKPDWLLTVREADFRGRGGCADKEYYARQWFPERLASLGLADGPRPVIAGADLLALGWLAGPEFGPIMTAAERFAEATSASKSEILDRLRPVGSPSSALATLTIPPNKS